MRQPTMAVASHPEVAVRGQLLARPRLSSAWRVRKALGVASVQRLVLGWRRPGWHWRWLRTVLVVMTWLVLLSYRGRSPGRCWTPGVPRTAAAESAGPRGQRCRGREPWLAPPFPLQVPGQWVTKAQGPHCRPAGRTRVPVLWPFGTDVCILNDHWPVFKSSEFSHKNPDFQHLLKPWQTRPSGALSQ